VKLPIRFELQPWDGGHLRVIGILTTGGGRLISANYVIAKVIWDASDGMHMALLRRVRRLVRREVETECIRVAVAL
jgi:hypothetical protein